jgi:hypothetical protein
VRYGFEDTELSGGPWPGRAHQLLPAGAPTLQFFIFSSSFIFLLGVNEGVVNLSLDRTSILLGEAYIV